MQKQRHCIAGGVGAAMRHRCSCNMPMLQGCGVLEVWVIHHARRRGKADANTPHQLLLALGLKHLPECVPVQRNL